MGAVLDVTVPCPSCEGEVGYGDAKCSKCGARVPGELREALDERLASASPEFALLREHQRTASWTLLIIALVLWAEGVIVFAADRFGAGYVPDSTALTSALITLVSDGLLGVVFVGAHLAARNAPVVGSAVGAAAWLAVNVALVTQSTAIVVSLYGIAIRVVLLLLLVRGLVSAVRANGLRRRLVQTA